MRAIGASSPSIRSARSCPPDSQPVADEYMYPFSCNLHRENAPVSPLIKRSEKPALLSLKLVSGAPRVRATSRPSSDQSAAEAHF
jgi:hypothetical protein